MVCGDEGEEVQRDVDKPPHDPEVEQRKQSASHREEGNGEHAPRREVPDQTESKGDKGEPSGYGSTI